MSEFYHERQSRKEDLVPDWVHEICIAVLTNENAFWKVSGLYPNVTSGHDSATRASRAKAVNVLNYVPILSGSALLPNSSDSRIKNNPNKIGEVFHCDVLLSPLHVYN